MSLKYTMQTAMDCVQYMNKSGFVPKSILNIGVSSAPECRIWKRLYPDVPVIGIDPKVPRSWIEFPYIQAVATDKTSESVQFCWKCFSLICLHPSEHKRRNKWRQVSAIRIDDIPAKLLTPPYFIWMDIEGGEMLALKGAEKTLERTAWICIETFDWVSGYVDCIDKWLRSRGFEKQHQFDIDALYKRTLPLGQCI